jgi:hypothetical protein
METGNGGILYTIFSSNIYVSHINVNLVKTKSGGFLHSNLITLFKFKKLNLSNF